MESLRHNMFLQWGGDAGTLSFNSARLKGTLIRPHCEPTNSVLLSERNVRGITRDYIAIIIMITGASQPLNIFNKMQIILAAAHVFGLSHNNAT